MGSEQLQHFVHKTHPQAGSVNEADGTEHFERSETHIQRAAFRGARGEQNVVHLSCKAVFQL